jgi:glutathione S-transferase
MTSSDSCYVDGNPIDWEHRYHGRGPADEAVVSKYATELDSALKVYDGILAKQKYLGGDQFTLVDVYHLPYGQMVYDLGYKETFEKYANVRAWWESITGRESWKNVAAGKV